jgi:hypothetical protein
MKFYGSEEISKYVPELRMGLRDGVAALPREILTLMRSVADQQVGNRLPQSGQVSI